MYKFGAKVIWWEIERIRLYFGLRENEVLIYIGLDGIEPIPIIPNMEVLLILEKEHFDEFHLSFDDARINWE